MKIRWTATLIRQLRGKRALADFGKLLGVPKNTVWRWEKGNACPDKTNASRLSALAHREKFLADWKLAGSAFLIGELEPGHQLMNALISSNRWTARSNSFTVNSE